MDAKTRSARLSKMITLGILSALSFLVMFVGRVPVVLFLKYDPKDVIIAMGGFIFGPLSAFLMSLVVSLVEMVTVSEGGPIGCLMNVLSTCAFVCTAAAIYRKKKTLAGAAVGLVIGCLLMTGTMLLWNYFVTPLYMNVPRDVVVGLLLPAFLPFNLLKSGLNTALIMLLYKPLVNGLRIARLLPPSFGETGGRSKWGVPLVSLAVLATCVLLVLVMQGVI